jgi:hypothetical protein
LSTYRENTSKPMRAVSPTTNQEKQWPINVETLSTVKKRFCMATPTI